MEGKCLTFNRFSKGSIIQKVKINMCKRERHTHRESDLPYQQHKTGKGNQAPSSQHPTPPIPSHFGASSAHFPQKNWFLDPISLSFS